jgi:hypothetical protein
LVSMAFASATEGFCFKGDLDVLVVAFNISYGN